MTSSHLAAASATSGPRSAGSVLRLAGAAAVLLTLLVLIALTVTGHLAGGSLSSGLHRMPAPVRQLVVGQNLSHYIDSRH